MATMKHNVTGPDETVRGFEVCVKDIRSERKERWITYPPSGHPKYSGEDALDVMERFEARGWNEDRVYAYTESFGTIEKFTTKEMRELYP